MHKLIWVHRPARFWQTVVCGILVFVENIQSIEIRKWGSCITFTNGNTLNVSESPLEIAEIIVGKRVGAYTGK